MVFGARTSSASSRAAPSLRSQTCATPRAHRRPQGNCPQRDNKAVKPAYRLAGKRCPLGCSSLNIASTVFGEYGTIGRHVALRSPADAADEVLGGTEWRTPFSRSPRGGARRARRNSRQFANSAEAERRLMRPRGLNSTVGGGAIVTRLAVDSGFRAVLSPLGVRLNSRGSLDGSLFGQFAKLLSAHRFRAPPKRAPEVIAPRRVRVDPALAGEARRPISTNAVVESLPFRPSRDRARLRPRRLRAGAITSTKQSFRHSEFDLRHFHAAAAPSSAHAFRSTKQSARVAPPKRRGADRACAFGGFGAPRVFIGYRSRFAPKVRRRPTGDAANSMHFAETTAFRRPKVSSLPTYEDILLELSTNTLFQFTSKDGRQ